MFFMPETVIDPIAPLSASAGRLEAGNTALPYGEAALDNMSAALSPIAFVMPAAFHLDCFMLGATPWYSSSCGV